MIPSRIDRAGKYPVQWVPRPYHTSLKTDLKAPPAAILHTEEGTFDGSERIFAVHYTPTFAVGIHQGKPTIWQHVPVGIAALSCRAHNDKALVEVELEAFSKETPWAPDPVRLDLLAELMRACRDVWNIPLVHPWQDGDWGRAGDNPHRHSGKYGHVAGWFGHQDLPPPDVHWDPGNFLWSKVFARAAEIDKAAHGPWTPAPTLAKKPPLTF